MIPAFFPLTTASVIILTRRIFHHSVLLVALSVGSSAEGETVYSSSWGKKSLEQEVAWNSNAGKQIGSAVGEGGTRKLGSKTGTMSQQFVLVPQNLGNC